MKGKSLKPPSPIATVLVHSLHDPLVLRASVPMAQNLGQNLVLMTCLIRICLMSGECVAGLLFEGLGASRRTRKSMYAKAQSLGMLAKGNIALVSLFSDDCYRPDPLCPFSV